MIQSVKQKGKQSGVWKKKWKRNIFLKQIGKFLLKYFFGKKKILQDPTHPHDNACT